MRIAINGFYWNALTTGTGQYARALVRAMTEQEKSNEYVIVMPRGESEEISAPPEFSGRVFR